MAFRILTGSPFERSSEEFDVLRYLSDSFFNVFGKVEEWLEIGGSGGEPAFENSWANTGGSGETAAFYKDPYGRVYLKGEIDTGTGGTTAFTLPSKYRPAATLSIPVTDNSGTARYVNITSAGLVQPSAFTTSIFLDGVSFRAEQ